MARLNFGSFRDLCSIPIDCMEVVISLSLFVAFSMLRDRMENHLSFLFLEDTPGLNLEDSLSLY